MTIQGTNLFLCLRPAIFGVEDEHVTLRYFSEDETRVWVIDNAIVHWQNELKMPVTIKVNGYAGWDTGRKYCHVALVGFHEYPELSWSKNWHITLESSNHPIQPYTYDRDADAFRYDICDRLWLGYKDLNGERQYIEAEKFYTLVEPVEQSVGE